jgi:hypothetical protein
VYRKPPAGSPLQYRSDFHLGSICAWVKGPARPGPRHRRACLQGADDRAAGGPLGQGERSRVASTATSRCRGPRRYRPRSRCTGRPPSGPAAGLWPNPTRAVARSANRDGEGCLAFTSRERRDLIAAERIQYATPQYGGHNAS